VIVGSLLSTVGLLGTWGSFLWLATYIDRSPKARRTPAPRRRIVSQWQSVGHVLGGFMGGVLAGWLGNKRSWCLLCIATWVSVMALFGLTTQFRHGRWHHGDGGRSVRDRGISAGCRNISRSFPDAHPRHGPGLRLQHRPHPHGLSACSAWACWRSSSRATNRRAAMTMASVYLLGLIVIIFAPETGGKMRGEEK